MFPVSFQNCVCDHGCDMCVANRVVNGHGAWEICGSHGHLRCAQS